MRRAREQAGTVGPRAATTRRAGPGRPEYWVLLVRDRGWSPQRFGEDLVDAWTRLLLAP